MVQRPQRGARLITALAVAAGLTLSAGCGDDDGGEEAPPLDPAAVKAAIEESVEVTQFCEDDQLALAPGDTVTCPAATRLEQGPVEGDLTLTREGDEPEISYELTMGGPGGSKAGGGTFLVEEAEADGEQAAGNGSALERRLSESLEGAEVSCDSERPPARGAKVSCTASGEDEEGVAFEGKVTVQRAPESAFSKYSYSAELEKEDGGVRYSTGFFDLKG